MTTQTILIDKSRQKKVKEDSSKPPSTNRLVLVWKSYRKQLIALIIFVMICVFFITIASLPQFSDISMSTDADRIRQLPSPEHWLGTNHFGQDAFNLLLLAIKNSIIFGFTTAAICTLFAVIFGVIGPYIGGIFDTLSQFITNVALVFPVIPFILLLSSLTSERSISQMILVISLFYWPWAARSIRAQVLTIKERDYIKISKMSGVGSLTIAIKDVLPNVFNYIFLTFTVCTGIAIQVEAGIAMLGLGQQDYVTLGTLLEHVLLYGYIPAYKYHLWIPPGIVLMVFLVAIYALHGSFSSTFNPKTREDKK